MSRSEEKAKGWRILSLVVIVSLACVYFATWEATKRLGIYETIYVIENDGSSSLYSQLHPGTDIFSPAPLIICVSEIADGVDAAGNRREDRHRTWFIWFGGYPKRIIEGRPTE